VVSRYDGGPESVYMIGPDEHLAAAYYRNTIVHHFVNEGIIELAVLRAAEIESGDPVDVFWDEAFRLRDLLKFEFFFAEKDLFREELREELVLAAPDWEERMREGNVRSIVTRLRPFMAHRALRPFLEAYQVVADRLQICDPHKPFNEPIFVPGCLGLGSQYLLQRHIRSGSSVSKALFETGLKLARNRGLLDGPGDEIAARRLAFNEEIRDALRRVDAIEALAASRRTGLIP
jgi:glycerol-3-phosphate O-acyltransferase